MKLCAAQLKSEPGNIESNVFRHARMAEQAASFGAELVIFPELSLTGYEPALAKTLASRPDDPRLQILQAVSDEKGIVIGAGLPLQAARGVEIGLVFFYPHAEAQLYGKHYLHSDEMPFFIPSGRDLILDFGGVRIAPAICYESLLSEHSDGAAEKGATLYFASVAKSAAGVEKANQHMPEIARKHSMPVLMANAIGVNDNFISFGSSTVWDKKGNLLARLDHENKGLLLYDTLSETATAERIQ